ncbi:MAG: hypothetical protein QNJ94_18645 [Alphaproteobacteria bacterium]|nr:hypothetical protein [Alphaproteobacteria bacterium]
MHQPSPITKHECNGLYWDLILPQFQGPRAEEGELVVSYTDAFDQPRELRFLDIDFRGATRRVYYELSPRTGYAHFVPAEDLAQYHAIEV